MLILLRSFSAFRAVDSHKLPKCAHSKHIRAGPSFTKHAFSWRVPRLTPTHALTFHMCVRGVRSICFRKVPYVPWALANPQKNIVTIRSLQEWKYWPDTTCSVEKFKCMFAPVQHVEVTVEVETSKAYTTATLTLKKCIKLMFEML